MKITSLLAVSLLCLTAGAAFAEGDGGFGVPQSPNSLPSGFVAGNTAPNDDWAILSENNGQRIVTDVAPKKNMDVAAGNTSTVVRR